MSEPELVVTATYEQIDPTTIRFADAPPVSDTKRDPRMQRLGEFLQLCRENPGKWIEYPFAYKNAAGAKSSVAHGRKAYPDHQWSQAGNRLWASYQPRERNTS